MTQAFDEAFESVCAHARHAAILQSVADALEWDERTGMPIQGSEYRATQVSTLRAMCHTHLTDPSYGEQLQILAQKLPETSDSKHGSLNQHGDVACTIRGLLRDWQRNCKLPVELVRRTSEATVRGQQLWDKARKADDFHAFAPALGNIIELKREAGTLLADGGDAYEALVDEYEPGADVKSLAKVFESLRDPLIELVARLQQSSRQPNIGLLQRSHSTDGQRKLSRFVAEAVGFDFSRGRLDETSHPFCTNLGPNDCRILSRYDQHWLPAGLFGTLHEAGHGMYDQGLRTQWYGLPPGSYVSLGIHESQSRLWENQVGRSLAFWKWLLPIAKPMLGGSLDDCSVEEMHFAVNAVRPSLIRVEADEATYNLHIIIRFELEQALMAGELEVGDLPAAWDEAYERYLGVRAPSAADGVLQDVHWSAGLFGYFPTYTLGNLASAQLFSAAERDLGPLSLAMERGEFGGLLGWLRDRIHRHGRCFTGSELIKNATNSELSAEPLLESLRSRYAELYD
jgi:carboxypeptidase Taq